jgi:site-specific DNA-methyltransferase (adenine-specific)
MRWLVRLVTPRGGLVLDPFGGSGATAWAAEAEGRRCVLIEREPKHAEHIAQVLAAAAPAVLAAEAEDGPTQLPLF